MALLSRDAILQAQDLPTERVEIPEWNGEVIVRGLTAAERDQFEQAIVEAGGKDTRVNLRNIRAKLVALCVVDEEGKRLCKDDDAEVLGRQSGVAMKRISGVAEGLSGRAPDHADGPAG